VMTASGDYTEEAWSETAA